jgi:thiamine-monophosphate kinase
MRSEFDFIQNIKNRFDLNYIGDDCAVYPKDDKTDLLVTTDLLVEGVDFHLDWGPPEFIGYKSLAVSLSDVAAMGGEPKWSLVSLGVPERLWNSDFLDRFYDGWHDLAKEFEVEMVGGDVSRSPNGLVIDSIVGGEVAKDAAVTRRLARPGELILVTGELGGAAGGLRLLNDGLRYDEELESWQKKLLRKQLRPWPQLGNALVIILDNTATAMIDISDGFSSDLAHICEASGVGARIVAESIPIDSNLEKLELTDEAKLDLALNGGEDFELLFTAHKEKISKVDEKLFTVVGEITANPGKIELISGNDVRILEPGGYRHF